MDDQTSRRKAAPSRLASRRQLATGIAWAAPPAAVATAAPAYAASRDELSYRFRGSVYSDFTTGGWGCYDGYGRSGEYLSGAIRLNNISLPVTTGNTRGFTVVEEPMAPSGQMSPRTTATLADLVRLVIAYPRSMINTNSGTNGFTFALGSTTWSGPARSSAWLRNPAGYSMTYDVFTFTFTGTRSQSTVTNRTGSTATTNWIGSQLDGTFAANTSYCAIPEPYLYGNYILGGAGSTLPYSNLGSFTTANGFTGTPRNIGWFTMSPSGY